MAELLSNLHSNADSTFMVRSMRLYCWPCRTVHELEVAEVERIVYALGAAETVAYDSGFMDGSGDVGDGTRTRAAVSTCLRQALIAADHPEVFAEHVEQGIECREMS